MSGCSMKQVIQSRVHVATESGSAVRNPPGWKHHFRYKQGFVLINFCSPKIIFSRTFSIFQGDIWSCSNHHHNHSLVLLARLSNYSQMILYFHLETSKGDGIKTSHFIPLNSGKSFTTPQGLMLIGRLSHVTKTTRFLCFLSWPMTPKEVSKGLIWLVS